MARPTKLTLDWFMHDQGARNDRKIKRVTRKWKAEGYALYFMLLEMLIAEKGMQLSLADTEIAEIVAEETFCRDVHHMLAMISSMVDAELFDRQLWEAERIVFSPKLFARYEDRIKANKQAAVRKAKSREAKKSIEASYDERLNKLNASLPNSNLAHAHADLNPDLNTDTDPDPNTYKQTHTHIHMVSQSDNSRQPCDNQVVTSDNEEDRQAVQFLKLPWKDSFNNIEEAFLDFVSTQMPTNGRMHPKLMAKRFIRNREREGQLAALYDYWDQFKSEPEKEKPVKSRLKPVRHSPEEAEAKFRELLDSPA